MNILLADGCHVFKSLYDTPGTVKDVWNVGKSTDLVYNVVFNEFKEFGEGQKVASD